MAAAPMAAALMATALPTHAASDLANPLNIYVGTSQANYPAQAAFLALSGLEASFVWGGGDGAWEKIYFFDTGAVSPEVPGAKFGQGQGGDAGRNYLRTVETDYHTKDFTALVTVERTVATSGAFFGLGTAALAEYKSPDRNTANASVFLELQGNYPNASRRVTGNGINTEVGYNAMTFTTNRALRLRMQYNSTLQQVTYSLDYDYDGTFVPDQTLPTFSVATQVAEWYAGDRASIAFGGDGNVVFTDLVITTAAAPAPPPTGLSVTSVGNATVNLAWNTTTPGNTYAVYRSTVSGDFGAPPVPLASGLTTGAYTDTAVINGTTYFYVLTQTNSNPPQSTFSAEVSATPVASAQPPAGIMALNAGGNAVLVDWSDLLSPFNTYKVYRSPDGGLTFSVVATGLTESRFLNTTGLTNGNTYTYKVTSVLNGGESAGSNTAEATPHPLEIFVDFNQGAATNADAGVLPAPSGSIWNGLGGAALIPILRDSLNQDSSVGLVSPGSATYASGNGWGVGGDNAAAGSQTLAGSYNLMQDYRYFFGKNTYTLTGLFPGRKYDLYLYGYGDASGQNTAFLAGGIIKQTKDPRTLTVLTQGRHYVNFTVEASFDGSVSVEMGSPGEYAASLTDADGPAGNGVLNGFQLVENSAAVLQPLSLSAVETPTSVDLSWDAVIGATSYKVYRSTEIAAGYTLLASPSSAFYSDTTGAAGIPYYYVVTALRGTVESFYSGEVKGTRISTIVDTDSDGLSDADEALIGTNPNDPGDFFVATSSSVAPTAGKYNVSFVINGARGNYVIERSATMLGGSWVPIADSEVTWTSGVLDNLILSASGVAPSPGGEEFFRAKGVVPAP